MKTKIITGLFLAMSCLGMQAQDKTQNYVRTRTYLSSDKKNYVDNIQYYDGIGRPLQTVSYGVKDTAQVGNTLATLQEYDDAGRETNSWLPTPINGSYADANTFKNLAKGNNGYSDANPYTTTVYEASPLNRISAQYGAGQAWHSNGKAVKTEYLLNTAQGGSYPCKYYYLNNNTLSGGTTYYGAATLKVTKVTDEDGKVSYTFVDKIGRKLLERQVVGSENLDTYYVYDDLGNIRYVLQPKYQEEASLAKYAFQYEYDGYNRCVKKTLPGTEPIIYVYDNTTNQLIYSQDGNQRAVSTTASAQKWTYYKYDAFYRVIEQGECTGKNNSNNAVVHLKNYYDDYNFIGTTGFTNNNYTAGNGYGKGYLTGCEVTILGSTDKIYKAYYYDQKGREVKTVQNNVQDGYDVTQITYTFSGKPSVVTHTHSTSNNSSLTEVIAYEYDHANRISTVTHKLGTAAAVTLASYTYDNFGRMQSKQLHGSQTQSYSYNIRNWLIGINSNQFTQSLSYNTGNGTAYYNGNISSMTWMSGSENTTRGYKFSYDEANRLLSGTYGEGSAISSNSSRFSESAAYDKNGNITSLQRYGQTGAGSYGLVDNLSYTLNGNQLSTVTDAVSTAAYGTNTAFSGTSSTYAYDANGNLTKDSGKGITNISYNCLNLPQEVTFSNGSSTTYTYAADGTKLAVKHQVGSANAVTTYYCGNVVYEGSDRKYLLHEEGYVDLANSNTYCYYLKDHQGNNRVVINGSGTVKETNHYYPFGGLFAGTSVQPFKYNGKELDSKNGLNWYDYGARHYDATLGRWHVVDPLTAKYYNYSSYAYCLNNPIKLIDPNGSEVYALDLFAQRNIINTLSKEERKYVSFDKNGKLNVNLLNKCESVSENFIALKTLVNSSIEFKFLVTDKDVEGVPFKSGNVNYYRGLTAIPGEPYKPSIDENVWIYTSSLEPELKQTENTAHEAYGHAYFYELKRSGKDDVDYHHRYINQLGTPQWDEDLKMMIPPLIRVDSNEKLRSQIKTVESQARFNYENNK